MRYLLDTHAILWALAGDTRLSARAAAVYESSAMGHFSIVSLWEIGIKLGLQRRDFVLSAGWENRIPQELTRLGLPRLDVSPKDCLGVAQLPMHHKDPFDRMLIAQASNHGLTIISCDPKFDEYEVERIW